MTGHDTSVLSPVCVSHRCRLGALQWLELRLNRSAAPLQLRDAVRKGLQDPRTVTQPTRLHLSCLSVADGAAVEVWAQGAGVAEAAWVAYIIIWLLQNLVEANFDLFRYLLLDDQLKPWELHPKCSYVTMIPAILVGGVRVRNAQQINID